MYILIDRSGAMDGDKIVAMNQGLQLLKSDLETEASAVESVWICVISFGGESRIEVPLTQLQWFLPPTLLAGGNAPLGGALQLLNDAIDRDVILSSGQPQLRDFKPLVLIFIDGEPNDEWREPARALRQRAEANRANIIAVGTGPQSIAGLKEIARMVLLVERVNTRSLLDLLEWFARSIKALSQDRHSRDWDASGSASSITLPPAPAGFEVVR